MKVSLLSENITSILPLINKILPTRSQVPILSNVLLIADNNGFKIKATDLELGAEVTVPAKIEIEGAITIPGKEFIEAISSFPKDKITLELDKDVLNVTCRESKIQFNTINADEFPKLYTGLGDEVMRFTHQEFVDIFGCLTFSVSTEDSRPQLTGVYVDNKGGYINFVSTDGYRMSIKKINAKKTTLTEGLIVSVALLSEVIALKNEGEVVLRVNKEENQIVFEVGDIVIVGRMLEGAYPDYSRVLPEESKTTIVFSRDELLQNTKLAAVFARENGNVASLVVKDNSMTLTTKTQGVGQGEMNIECQKKGEDNNSTFNIRYLLDVLKVLPVDQMELCLNSPSSPAIFKVHEKSFTHVIMPIQVD